MHQNDGPSWDGVGAKYGDKEGNSLGMSLTNVKAKTDLSYRTPSCPIGLLAIGELCANFQEIIL
jgi:hypothetical protein